VIGNKNMDTIYLDDFLTDGIIKEAEFRIKVDQINWPKYQNKRVMIKGCTSAPVPTWSYLIITAQLALHAKEIVYGEPCSAVKIFKKNND
tara:strand:+ start:343 stop:612 length:270 start_codon:yes stop_codon:yes gene_type:complete